MTVTKKSHRTRTLSTRSRIILATGSFFGLIAVLVYHNASTLSSLSQSIRDYRSLSLKSSPHVYVPLTPSTHQIAVRNDISPTPSDLPPPNPVQAQTGTSKQSHPDEAWGVAQKVDDVTYSIRVGYDSSMATPQEVYEALNVYRASKGSQALAWSDTLASYAHSRAIYFDSIKGTDKHAGFNTFLENEDGFTKLRFNRVGENSFYGGPLSGTHVIEWVFSQSPGHNANQLDTGWTHVGVGTSATAININFGSGEF